MCLDPDSRFQNTLVRSDGIAGQTASKCGLDGLVEFSLTVHCRCGAQAAPKSRNRDNKYGRVAADSVYPNSSGTGPEDPGAGLGILELRPGKPGAESVVPGTSPGKPGTGPGPRGRSRSRLVTRFPPLPDRNTIHAKTSQARTPKVGPCRQFF
jgi:hypothetical protein